MPLNYRAAPPSPTRTNGAQNAGCTSKSFPFAIIDSIERRNASAQPTSGSALNFEMALVMRLRYFQARLSTTFS
jgi:hypothetical protein